MVPTYSVVDRSGMNNTIRLAGDNMLHIKKLNDGLELFKTLGSDVRMRIVQLLSERGEMNMNEIASALELTNGALTAHIRRLEECGIIQTVTECTGHGNQKLCSMKVDQILVSGRTEEVREVHVKDAELQIGHFDAFTVKPPCGLCSVYRRIGRENDTHYFALPDRLQAGLLWFSEGYVEYRIPNMLSANQQIHQMMFYFEISSDQVGALPDSLAEIDFYLNERKIATWVTPPEFQWSKGIYTPAWWYGREKQFGLMKMIVLTRLNTYLDGLKVSEVGLDDFTAEELHHLKLRLSVEKRGRYRGGAVLYGAGFGNYNQDIHVRVHYTGTEL